VQRRACVDHTVKVYGVSAARACRIFNYNRSNLYYEKRMPFKDDEVKKLIQDNLGKGNCGRDAVIARIRKKHIGVSGSKIRRVYDQQGFSLYKRLKKRRIKNPANPIAVPFSANEEWAMDFMSDSLTNGRKLRTLNVMDQYNRECLAITVAHSIPARRVVLEMEKIIEKYGKPSAIRTDNGPEFTSKMFQNWLHEKKIKWSPIEKGKPQQNGIIERFNRTVREDVLDACLFHTLQQAQEKCDEFIKYYNEERPHKALGYKTPKEYAA
jgi:putative transposase